MKEITRLRGVAIFMVLLYHSILVYPINLEEVVWCSILKDFLWYIQMPLFFIVSGFCFSYEGKYIPYLKKKALRILLPHLIFGLIDILFRVAPDYIPALEGTVNQTTSLEQGIKEFLIYGGEDPFLRSLFIIAAVFPLFHMICKKSLLRYLVWIFAIVVYVYSEKITSITALNYASRFFMYYVLGYELRKIDYNKTKSLLINMKAYIAMFVLCMIAFFMLISYGNEKGLSVVVALSGAALMFSVTGVMKGIFDRFFMYLGTYSLQYYLMGGYALVVSRMLLISLLSIEIPAVIIIGNLIIDIAIMTIVIHFIIRPVKVFRFLTGLKGDTKK